MATIDIPAQVLPSYSEKDSIPVESNPQFSFKTTPYAPSINLSSPYPPGVTFPLALTPTASNPSINNLVSEIKSLSRSGHIRTLLTKHSSIYFANLNLKNAVEFSQFASSFGFSPYEDIGNPVRRTIYAPNVASANEGPNTDPVFPHNEFGLSPHYPAYVMFFCAEEPESGGETPVNNSVVLYEELRSRFPYFIEELEKKGVRYQLFYPNNPRENTTSAGTSVLQSYGIKVLDTDTVEQAREKVETEIRRLPTATWQWENQSESNPLGDLRVFQVLPATRKYEHTGHAAFFNNVISRYLNAIKAGSLEAPYLNKKGALQPPAFYGDGTEIPHKYLDYAVKIYKETRSLVRWKKGDVLLIDNHAVQHAREPWTGPRKLLASLWDEPEAK